LCASSSRNRSDSGMDGATLKSRMLRMETYTPSRRSGGFRDIILQDGIHLPSGRYR
jgi:hypothetical protein